MPDVKGGIATALDQVRPQDEAPFDEAEQLDLLGLTEVSEVEAAIGRRLSGPLAGPVALARGRGRPAGSRNRRTQDWANYLLARYASPLEVLAQMATASAEELALQLGCSKLEAFQEKRHAAVGLLPYLHQRMPLAVDLHDHRVVQLTIVDGHDGDGGGSLASEIIGIVESVEYQEVSGEQNDTV